MPDLVLYQPDIPGNTGTLLRLAACLDFTLHIIEPAGFRLDDKSLRRSGMDYLELAKLRRHLSWEAFQSWRLDEKRRLILLTTKSDIGYCSIAYRADDLLMLGRESSGVPDLVHEAADLRGTIHMQKGARSINMALSGAIVIGEALRQTSGFSAKNPT